MISFSAIDVRKWINAIKLIKYCIVENVIMMYANFVILLISNDFLYVHKLTIK